MMVKADRCMKIIEVPQEKQIIKASESSKPLQIPQNWPKTG